MATKYLDTTGLTHLWAKIKNYVGTALSGILSDSDPAMSGTKSAGVSTKVSRSDHVHPSDTSKQDVISDLSTIRSGAAAGATAYQKPPTGIPPTDLDSSLQSSISGKVDNTTTVNGHALSSNVTVTASDVGLGSVTNDAQVKRTEMGVANGVATLDGNGLVPSSQLPSYVDDIVEVYARTGQTALSSGWFSTTGADGSAITGESGKIYVLMADSGDYGANTQFRWGGTAYVKLSDGGVSPITTSEIDSITSN